jgi:S1-C subfamily serine protease
MHGSLLDVVLLVAVLVFAVSGYRQGFVVGGLSFAGFFGGCFLGLQLAPLIAIHVQNDVSRLGVALAVVFIAAVLGQTVAVVIGGRIRDRMRHHHLRRVDNIGGGVISAVALLLVVWMVAAPLASAQYPWVAAQVRRSAVLGAVDSIVPDPLRGLYASFSRVVGRGDFPEVFGRLTPTEVTEVAPPDPALVRSPAVTLAARSTVKILGEAPGCDRRLEGSGFVYAPHRVMTNAHVVAGVRKLNVQLGGDSVGARVVVYDPERDLAVLYVPDLDAPALPFARATGDPGQNAIVVGYPLDGPYHPTGARIRDSRTIKGPNIYNTGTVRRQVYTLRSEVKSGNSGGPLLDVRGAVLGVIFAAAADDTQTGFALTRDEAASVAATGRTATQRVSTQGSD